MFVNPSIVRLFLIVVSWKKSSNGIAKTNENDLIEIVARENQEQKNCKVDVVSEVLMIVAGEEIDFYSYDKEE